MDVVAIVPERPGGEGRREIGARWRIDPQGKRAFCRMSVGDAAFENHLSLFAFMMSVTLDHRICIIEVG